MAALWLAAAFPPAVSAQTSGPVTPNAVAAPAASPAPAPSPGVTDVLSLLKAGVSNDVILTYIRNAPIPFNPSAAEIIDLKDKGASVEVLTSLLVRGGELRARVAQPQPGAAPPVDSAPPYAPAPQYAPAPLYDYAPQSAYPAYSAYPDYTYGYPPYSYSDGWLDYGSPWPSIYGPAFYFGLGYPYYYGGWGRGYGYCPPFRRGGDDWGRGYRHPIAPGRTGTYVGIPGSTWGRTGGYRSPGYSRQPISISGRSGGFSTPTFAGRSFSQPSFSGGFRSGGSFSGRSSSFGGFGGAGRASGGFGGRGGGHR